MDSIKRTLISCSQTLLALCCLFYLSFGQADNLFNSDKQVVLVTHKSAPIPKLDRKDIRRIFLGLRPIKQTRVSKPVLNRSNPAIYKHFLKNVMFLTERGYKRKLVKRVFRQGADQIDSVNNVQQLKEHLSNNPYNISFMLEQDALQQPDIKIVQVLW